VAAGAELTADAKLLEADGTEADGAKAAGTKAAGEDPDTGSWDACGAGT